MIVATLFFVFFSFIDGILFLAGEVSIVSAIEYFEAIAGAEGLTLSAYLYKMFRSGNMEDLINFVFGLIDGTSDNEDDAKLKIKELERCKMKLLKRE